MVRIVIKMHKWFFSLNIEETLEKQITDLSDKK